MHVTRGLPLLPKRGLIRIIHRFAFSVTVFTRIIARGDYFLPQVDLTSLCERRTKDVFESLYIDKRAALRSLLNGNIQSKPALRTPA